MATQTSTRPTLGDFMSVTCFHFLRMGAEDIAGRVPIVAAGRERGAHVAEELGLINSSQNPNFIRENLYAALGPAGTRLCLVQAVTAKPNGGYEVRISEGACTAGVHADEPHCAYTMGVFVGAIGAITGQRMRGTETTCAAMGSPECVYQIDPI
jgi:predicted hydrocarbon binding protein